MSQKFKHNTTPFTIAHFILLFLVSIMCISIIAWIIITRNNNPITNNTSINVTHIKNTNPCVQRITNTVERMWAFNPKSVPEKYWEIATNYLNQPITTRTYGICQDIAFVCLIGQIRRDCDPCAVPDARAYAMDIHINDLIRTNCTQENTAN